MKKLGKKLLTLALAGIMVVGMGVTAFAAGRGAYSTSFSGSAAMSAMANSVFDGADMVYDEEADETTVTVYTKLYERAYNGSTAYGWISALELDEVTMKQVETASVDGQTYPIAFRATFDGDLTDGYEFDASVSIMANGYTHADQVGVLTVE